MFLASAIFLVSSLTSFSSAAPRNLLVAITHLPDAAIQIAGLHHRKQLGQDGVTRAQDVNSERPGNLPTQNLDGEFLEEFTMAKQPGRGGYFFFLAAWTLAVSFRIVYVFLRNNNPSVSSLPLPSLYSYMLLCYAFVRLNDPINSGNGVPIGHGQNPSASCEIPSADSRGAYRSTTSKKAALNPPQARFLPHHRHRVRDVHIVAVDHGMDGGDVSHLDVAQCDRLHGRGTRSNNETVTHPSVKVRRDKLGQTAEILPRAKAWSSRVGLSRQLLGP
ncbi:hypothetical protein BV898_10506 [Hypsibius exemplaris]|uniref:Uncharacterized protein n=1 Tax=Hypsibius exemplaris TaxID=2072580 RepID=A0A1W0WJH2_HYPEX|nr:hypothetical protein BV898_10506 [Hypsibius exemplaris]